MEVNVLASGSSGNCVTIDDTIIIDAGVDCNPKGKALLITHIHTDHTKALGKLGGVSIYTSQEVADKLSEKHPYLAFNVLETGKKYMLKFDGETYFVTAIRLKHDVPCIGFDIEHDGERILYATDFNEIVDDVDVRDYTALYLECNNTLNPHDLVDAFFGEEKPKDEFHRRKSYYNHCNVGYLVGLFERAGFTHDKPCDIPLTLLHKSSYYYLSNAERLVDLCKIANVKNPLMELVRPSGVTICHNLNENKINA